MIFVQFYQASAINPKELIEASGDRSVVILDGRERRSTHEAIAELECKRRGYLAWQLFSGSFLSCSPVGELNKVKE